jgi:hypothetical protein
MHAQLSQTFDLLSPTDLNAVCFKAEEDFEIKKRKKWLLTSESKLRHGLCIGKKRPSNHT